MKQIPKGYKHTTLGILPQDWEVVRLGDIGIFLKGSGISKENLSDSGIACIRYGELYTTYKEVINYVYCKTDIPIQGLVLSKKNDILIPTSGETAIDIATASCILLDGVAIGGDTNIVRTEQNGIYLAYCLNNMMKNRIASLAQGATVIHLYANHLKTLEIPLPPIKEQEKIAQILNTWDSYIGNLEKLIEAKQRYKKGLMQRLLTPPQEHNKGNVQYEKGKSPQPYGDIRALRFKEFSGTWQEVKLGEVFKITRGSVLPLSKISPCQNETFCYPVYSSQTKHNGLMGYYDKYMFENAITWTTDGVNAGNVKFRKGKFYCTNVCGVLLSDRGYANGCVAEILNLVTKKYVSYTGNPKLMNNVVSEIKIQMPTTLQEQEKIARVLSLCDEEIQTLKKMLESRKKQKRGLMQNLLSGKVRVKA